MAFTGNEGKEIDAATAQRWINNYQKGAAQGSIKAEFFGFRRIVELLGQDNAIGIRCYYGKDDAGADQLILVAVNPDEKNIGPIDGSKLEGTLMDGGFPCPPYCNNPD